MIRVEAVQNSDGSISFQSRAADPPLKTERVNETRYERTFTSDEVIEILKDKLLRESLQPSYKFGEATVVDGGPDGVPAITLKVVMPENLY